MVERFKPELEKPSLHNPCYSAFMRKTENGMWVHYIAYKKSQRALWLARAEVARISAQNWANSINTLTYYCGKFDNKEIEPRDMMDKWQWVERKCRAKAEEYL